MSKITYIPVEESNRIMSLDVDLPTRLTLVADVCRLNALAAIKSAGSGHIGSSFSSLDIFTMLLHDRLNIAKLAPGHADRDIFFSSKGHDAPGYYAVMHSLGLMSAQQLLKLRRVDGPCGHPDVKTLYVEANTGSLGMGISKAKGMAFAKSLAGNPGRVFVLTGDGEFQEGQTWEALQTAAHQRISNLHLIMDHNKVQSDRLVEKTMSLGDVKAKLELFGWYVAECDGHDPVALMEVFDAFEQVTDRPKALIAHTVKGKGVSFMEHTSNIAANDGWYKWHAGAPADEAYAEAVQELVASINSGLGKIDASAILTESADPLVPAGYAPAESVADAYGDALLEMGKLHDEVVVLDADLVNDCRVRQFFEAFPQRSIENGIAEQDMVSMAGGLALSGSIPVVNSFSAFLVARANEQIYNNVSEKTRIIYGCHYAGLLPAGPGHTHQSVRDISLLGALTDFTVIQPANPEEVRHALQYCVEQAPGSSALRIPTLPSPRSIVFPDSYEFVPGRGTVLCEGKDAVLLAYGPTMLNEALAARDTLAGKVDLKVVNMPWLNRVDGEWLAEIVRDVQAVFVLEDHAPVGGLGDRILSALVANSNLGDKTFRIFGVEGVPAWGTPQEALIAHGLDRDSLARRMAEVL